MHTIGCRHTRDDARDLAGRIAATVTGRTEYRHEMRHWIGHGMTEPPAGEALIVIWKPTPGCQAELDSLNAEKSGRISI